MENGMSTPKIGVSAYLLRPGVLDEVEETFDARTSLDNGLEGWFHFIEPERKPP